jgi:hypothetical protein
MTMQANYSKAMKSWFNLPKREQEAIRNMLAEEFNKQLNVSLDHEQAEAQKVWLKLMCIAANRADKYGELRCLRLLGNWKWVYKQIAKCKTSEERDAWIDSRINKIFRKSGYPQGFIDNLEGKGGN